MAKAKTNGTRPGRGTKGTHNPLLPADRQGSKYIVKGFIFQPRVTLLDAEGKEENEILGPQFGVFQSQLSETLPAFLEKRGFKMSSDGK